MLDEQCLNVSPLGQQAKTGVVITNGTYTLLIVNVVFGPKGTQNELEINSYSGDRLSHF